ncbi:MAG: N-acetylglucosamine-6-phosphate deacetylase [Eubacteriales bacterium]|nr:N-acetylglucosamine-6-phosphate deacetylase [Eubacteriales bacterium]
MLYKNAHIFTPRSGFILGSFIVEGDRFTDVTAGIIAGEGIDLEGAYVIPGLIDVHTHGNSGADFSDGIFEDDLKMGRFFAANGITSFAPASMTLPYDVLSKAFAAGRKLADERPADCARLAGINMEGPFFSEKKKGAQNGAYLKNPDFEAFQKLYDGCGGLIRIVDLAPELPGSVEFTEKASELCTVSVAHTDATYEEASAVFSAGASHATHLFNAMPAIHHRKPGVIGAASENDGVVAELICDGLHVHPSSVRMAFKLFPGRICLISDSLRCTGMPAGRYPFGGQEIELKNGECRLPDGTIAGSVATLYQCMLNAIEFGIPKDVAIRAATLTPAAEIGRAKDLGSIEAGKYADFVICDENLQRKEVYIGGIKI